MVSTEGILYIFYFLLLHKSENIVIKKFSL